MKFNLFAICIVGVLVTGCYSQRQNSVREYSTVSEAILAYETGERGGIRITGYLSFDADGGYLYEQKSGESRYLVFAQTPFFAKNLSGKKIRLTGTIEKRDCLEHLRCGYVLVDFKGLEAYP